LRKLKAQPAEALAWSRDAKTLAWPEWNYRVRLWKIDAPFVPPQGHVAQIFRLAFSPDGKTLASEAYRDGVLLWDTATGKHRRLPTGDDHLAHFEPDGKALVTAGSEKVRWWATATGRSVRVVASKDRGEGAPLAFSPGSRQFFANQSLRDGGPGLFESATGKELCQSPRPPFGANVAAFSPDGKTLATGGRPARRDGMRASH